uniref:Ig-like domain-containing protein n=1 Tax=Mola mola TaxID=94237 RepID=A0A3Q4B2X7_MOLML
MDITKHSLSSLMLSLLWIPGVISGSDVTQDPILWKRRGDSATISCRQSKGPTYFQMYWFRQLPGEAMKLIVFTTTGSQNHDFGNFSKEKFSATKPDAESGTFTVKDLEPQDKGLYFCAASEHSDTGDTRSCSKTSVDAVIAETAPDIHVNIV